MVHAVHIFVGGWQNIIASQWKRPESNSIFNAWWLTWRRWNNARDYPRNLLVAIGENNATYILYAFFSTVPCSVWSVLEVTSAFDRWWGRVVATARWGMTDCGPCGEGSPTTEGTWARYHYCGMTLSQEIYTMGAQLSVKAVLPLTEILATSDSCSNTGPGWWFARSGEFGEIVATRKLPESKVHGVNMEPIWGRQDPGGPHVGPMYFAIWIGWSASPGWARHPRRACFFHVWFYKLSFSNSVFQIVLSMLSIRKPYQFMRVGKMNPDIYNDKFS